MMRELTREELLVVAGGTDTPGRGGRAIQSNFAINGPNGPSINAPGGVGGKGSASSKDFVVRPGRPGHA